MTPDEQLDADAVVESEWPYDGPYGRERTVEAGFALAALARYLGNATGKASALDGPSTAASTVYGIHATTVRLDQVLGQLDGYVTRAATTSTLYDDRRDRPATQTVDELAIELLSARTRLAEAAEALARAHSAAAHLGVED